MAMAATTTYRGRRQNVHSRWIFGSLCLLLFSANPSSIFALPGGGMIVGVDAAPTSSTSASSHEERRRERRRQEREQRRQQSKPRPGRNQQNQKAKEEEEKQSFDFEDVKSSMIKLSMFHQPKDVFEGTIKALQSVFVGASVGLVSAVGIPLLALYSQLRTDEGRPENPSPVLGFLVGAIMGGITGTVSTLAGVATAAFQLGAGIWNTFGAFQAARQGMRWDERTRTWVHYSLEQEAEELNIGASSSGTKRTNSKVQDTGFYDMLGVSPNASGKEIKRAYYQKAKVMHPDKRPEDPEKAAEDFLKLHSAYHTLSDDKKRADYDKWGISGDDNGGAGGSLPFDVSVFFAVMFDFQRVEPYIGELTIASFIDGILKLSQMASQNQNLNEGVPPFIFEQLWGSDTQPRKRQVEIAQNLLSRIDGYMKGAQTAEEFRQSAAEEADNIIGGGRDTISDSSSSGDLLGFTDKLLDTIGSGLVLESGHYLAFHQRKPFLLWPAKGTLYAASRKKNKWARRMRSATKTVQLIRKAFTNGAIQFDSDSEKENDDADEKKNKAMEDLLPDLIDTAGTYILSDISKAIQGACWRLFFDSATEKDTRVKRAEALNILGQEFLRRGERTNNSDNKTACVDESARSEGAKDRILRAFEISQMKAQGHDDSSHFHEE